MSISGVPTGSNSGCAGVMRGAISYLQRTLVLRGESQASSNINKHLKFNLFYFNDTGLHSIDLICILPLEPTRFCQVSKSTTGNKSLSQLHILQLRHCCSRLISSQCSLRYLDEFLCIFVFVIFV